MPLAGYLSATGNLDFWLAVACGSVGSLLGACVWYSAGRKLGRDRLRRWAGRHGAWVAMTPEDIERAADWFGRHGRPSVFVCRMLPFLRTVISVPAGLAGMPLPSFLLYSAGGTLLWTLGLAGGGLLLGSSFPEIESALGWVSWTVIGAATLAYLYRVLKVHRERDGNAEAATPGN
jgi:membrane protein DedA with SNARE-associated domain